MEKIVDCIDEILEITKDMQNIPIVEAIVFEKTTIGSMPFNTLYIVENTRRNYLEQVTGKKYFEKTDELQKIINTKEEKREISESINETYQQEMSSYNSDIEKFNSELQTKKLAVKAICDSKKENSMNEQIQVYTTNKTNYINGNDGQVNRSICVLFDRTNRIIIEEESVKVKTI